jgi:4-hydroxybenzoate polyprenyltransferase
MKTMREFSDDNDPAGDPAPTRQDSPHFGRLLAVLALAILLIVAITFASEAYLG